MTPNKSPCSCEALANGRVCCLPWILPLTCNLQWHPLIGWHHGIGLQTFEILWIQQSACGACLSSTCPWPQAGVNGFGLRIHRLRIQRYAPSVPRHPGNHKEESLWCGQIPPTASRGSAFCSPGQIAFLSNQSPLPWKKTFSFTSFAWKREYNMPRT